MKKTIKISLILFFSLFYKNIVTAQSISNEVLMAIKNENFQDLDKLITDDDLNKCYEVRGSSYNFLAISIKMKSLESLKYFVKRKANLEGECTGKTPLMYATKYGQLNAVKYLIENGASLETTNRGRTALDYAKKYEQQEIENYLNKYKK
ncbi:ankyrin repeat domain-containing protein [Tenacibaculum xiamenense]|uniref:ankyrin repeat domain-containing protein n=1 Tax=Tenacibaculum xiamenense TaxID=1261553 RepID=UPI0038942285